MSNKIVYINEGDSVEIRIVPEDTHPSYGEWKWTARMSKLLMFVLHDTEVFFANPMVNVCHQDRFLKWDKARNAIRSIKP